MSYFVPANRIRPPSLPQLKKIKKGGLQVGVKYGIIQVLGWIVEIHGESHLPWRSRLKSYRDLGIAGKSEAKTKSGWVPRKVKKMKKLMFAATAAVCAAVTFGLESANVVGYNNTDARADLNWYAPMFLTAGANTTDINAIQLDDGGVMSVGWGDVMQVVGPLGNPETMYCYWDPMMDPNAEATTYYWGDEMGNPVSVSFDAGDGVGIDNMNALEFKLRTAGEVPAGKVSFAARADLNWSGNPFPAAINLNAVQLNDDGAMSVGWGDVMQIVGPLGNPEAMYCYWDPMMDPNAEATTYYWGDGEGNPVDVELAPGAGFAIDNMNALEFDIEIACPY